DLHADADGGPRDRRPARVNTTQPRGPNPRHEGMRLRRTPLIAIATAVLTAGALTAAMLSTGTAATAEPVGTSHPARAAQPAGVPWSHVGPGWVLAQYTTAAPEGSKPGPVTLYLISPGGARYKLARWPDFRSAPEL